MKNLLYTLVGLGVMALVIGLVLIISSGSDSANAGVGNGLPTGPHYNLNLVAHNPNNRPDDNTVSSGHTIHMLLDDTNERDGVIGDADCKILLTKGDFQVLDKFCLDGDAAFQLPDPCAADNVVDDPNVTECSVTSYSVWLAVHGKPGGGMDMETCFTDTAGTNFCSIETVIAVRAGGKPNWKDVSKCLLTVYANIDADAAIERTFLFSPIGTSWWWEYDNWGNILASLRFYATPGTIENAGADCVV